MQDWLQSDFTNQSKYDNGVIKANQCHYKIVIKLENLAHMQNFTVKKNNNNPQTYRGVMSEAFQYLKKVYKKDGKQLFL